MRHIIWAIQRIVRRKFFGWLVGQAFFFLKNEINSRQIKQKISQNSSTLTQQKQQIAAEHRNNQRGYSKQEHNTNSKQLQNTKTIILLH